MPKPLTDQQRLFVEEYLKDLNQSRAARAAGYSDINAHKTSRFILAREDVKEIIKRAAEKVEEKGIYNLEMAHKEVSDLLALAVEMKQMNAAANLMQTKAKLFGLLVEKLHVQQARNFQINFVGISAPNAPKLVSASEPPVLLPPNALEFPEDRHARLAKEEKELMGENGESESGIPGAWSDD